MTFQPSTCVSRGTPHDKGTHVLRKVGHRRRSTTRPRDAQSTAFRPSERFGMRSAVRAGCTGRHLPLPEFSAGNMRYRLSTIVDASERQHSEMSSLALKTETKSEPEMSLGANLVKPKLHCHRQMHRHRLAI
jgi:hypothetical protein